jgi:hypothetical protein
VKFQRNIVLSYSGSVTPRKLAAMQEYYIGMDNKDDGKPWGGTTARDLESTD